MSLGYDSLREDKQLRAEKIVRKHPVGESNPKRKTMGKHEGKWYPNVLCIGKGIEQRRQREKKWGRRAPERKVRATGGGSEGKVKAGTNAVVTKVPCGYSTQPSSHS